MAGALDAGPIGKDEQGRSDDEKKMRGFERSGRPESLEYGQHQPAVGYRYGGHRQWSGAQEQSGQRGPPAPGQHRSRLVSRDVIHLAYERQGAPESGSAEERQRLT